MGCVLGKVVHLTLQVAPGNAEGADIGPLISPEARQRCIDLITSAEKDVGSSPATVDHGRQERKKQGEDRGIGGRLWPCMDLKIFWGGV